MNEGTTGNSSGQSPAPAPQSNVSQILDWLDGRKTYLIALVGIAYLMGAGLGLWPEDERILGLLGFGGIAALRAGVAKGQS